MKNWPRIKIGDVCEIARGGSPRPIDKYITDAADGINWIKIGDASDSMYITSTAQKIIPEGMKKSRYVQAGDFLLSNSMSFGRPYILKIDGCIHDGWLVLRDKDNLFDKRFLYYYLSAPSTYLKFKSLAVGGVVNNLNSEMVCNVDAPLPALDAQRRAADVLDKVSDLTALRKQQLARLDELVRARFTEMFGEISFNTNGYKTERLGDIAFVTKLAGFEYTKYIQYQDHGDIIMIRGLNCKKTKLVLDDIYWINQETSDMLPRSKLFAGDILMTYVGTVGEVALIDADNRYHLAPNVAKISLNDKRLYIPQFFVYMFMYCRDYIMKHASSTTQSALSMGKIRDIAFPIPPTDSQMRFSAFVKQVSGIQLILRQSLDKLEALKKSLMQDYFG